VTKIQLKSSVQLGGTGGRIVCHCAVVHDPKLPSGHTLLLVVAGTTVAELDVNARPPTPLPQRGEETAGCKAGETTGQ
jgi:hypothetical protein